MKRIFGEHKNNLVVVTSELLSMLQVKVNQSSIKLALENHPDFPSLLSISDCLLLWGVNNEAYRVGRGRLKLQELSFPFVAYFKENGGHFVFVHRMENDFIYFSDENYKDTGMQIETFLYRWSGIILQATKTRDSGESMYLQNLIKSTLKQSLVYLSIGVLLAITYLIFKQHAFSWPYLISYLVKLVGIGVTILLLMQSVNVNNPTVQNFCSLGGQNDCNTILKSDAAKVNSWLNWSELGFFYFAGSTICLLFSPDFMHLLAWLNILVIPYTIYSIGYQFKYENWCVLCITVQILFWIEFIVNLSWSVYQPLNLSVDFLLKIAIAFIVPIAIWTFLKPLFSDAIQLSPLKLQLNKFKYNKDLFTQALTSQPCYSIQDELMPLVLGNRDSKTIITMVSNPYCLPCEKSHELLEEWLENGDDFRLNVVFVTSNNQDDPRIKVVHHLRALSMNNKLVVPKALNDWYKSKNKVYEDWAKQYPVNMNEELITVFNKQKDWCDLAEITSTPTFLLNGYKLPAVYHLQDLKYLING